MELKGGNFYKFQKLGDIFQGRFVAFDRDVEGNFGPRDQLTLKTRNGIQIMDCSKFLAGIFRAHESELKDKIVTVTWTDNRPPKKAGMQPMKVFHVDVSDKLEDVKAPVVKTATGGGATSIGDEFRTQPDDDKIPF